MSTDLPYQRTYLRYPIQYPLIFGYASGVGEGQLSNLSFNGCSVLCDHTVEVGAEVRLSVFLPDHTQALPIDGGTIQWAEDGQFGVEFRALPVRTRLLLNRLLRQALILAAQTRSHPADRSELSGQPRP